MKKIFVGNLLKEFSKKSSTEKFFFTNHLFIFTSPTTHGKFYTTLKTHK